MRVREGVQSWIHRCTVYVVRQSSKYSKHEFKSNGVEGRNGIVLNSDLYLHS